VGQVGLYKTGAGTLTLNHVNAYSGSTTVNAGVLYAGTAGALSTSSAFVINSGTLDASAYAQTIGSLTMTTSNAGLNLAYGNQLTCTTATFNGTLNVTNFTGGTDPLMAYTTTSGTFATVDVNGSPLSSASAYQLAYLSTELEIVPAGPPTWANLSGGSWSVGTNWNGGSAPTNTAGAAAIVGAPTTSQVTITLDIPQTLGSLTFASSSSSGYTLTPGVSGTGSLTMATSDGSAAQIVVTSGSHFIEANVTLTGSLAIAPTAGSTLEIDGNMSESLSGSGSLLLNDAGTLILSGTNSFSGGTAVTNGTLILTNNEALAGGSSLTIGDASAFAGGPTGAGSDTGAISSGLSAPLAASPSITPVPEPSTFVLLAAGAVLLAVYRKRRRG
jgi:autotransporter-associated beta strand protein